MILKDTNIADLFCAHMSWPIAFLTWKFENDKGERGLRFEVKCLQSTAEEKSANFATLRKDIQPPD